MAKNLRKDRKPVREPLYDAENIASFTECTGLMPAPVQDEDAAEAYADLYAIHKPKVGEEQNLSGGDL
ncbi:MAG: hypothetical protein FWF69_10705 [Firmicutes bacterium]|nr:hypothetical protein [Bacillota bacterium]